MRGREEVRRRRFACEEQPAIHRGGEDGAGAGVAGACCRIGALRERIMRPARFGERRQARAKIRTEQRHDFIDGLCRQRAGPGVFQLARKRAAIEAFDRGRAERPDLKLPTRALTVGPRRPESPGSASAPASASNTLLLVPSGRPRAASTFAGSGGSKRMVSSASRLVGTVTITRPALSVPFDVSIRMRGPA